MKISCRRASRREEKLKARTPECHGAAFWWRPPADGGQKHVPKLAAGFAFGAFFFFQKTGRPKGGKPAASAATRAPSPHRAIRATIACATEEKKENRRGSRKPTPRPPRGARGGIGWLPARTEWGAGQESGLGCCLFFPAPGGTFFGACRFPPPEVTDKFPGVNLPPNYNDPSLSYSSNAGIFGGGRYNWGFIVRGFSPSRHVVATVAPCQT